MTSLTVLIWTWVHFWLRSFTSSSGKLFCFSFLRFGAGSRQWSWTGSDDRTNWLIFWVEKLWKDLINFTHRWVMVSELTTCRYRIGCNQWRARRQVATGQRSAEPMDCLPFLPRTSRNTSQDYRVQAVTICEERKKATKFITQSVVSSQSVRLNGDPLIVGCNSPSMNK